MARHLRRAIFQILRSGLVAGNFLIALLVGHLLEAGRAYAWGELAAELSGASPAYHDVGYVCGGEIVRNYFALTLEGGVERTEIAETHATAVKEMHLYVHYEFLDYRTHIGGSGSGAVCHLLAYLLEAYLVHGDLLGIVLDALVYWILSGDYIELDHGVFVFKRLMNCF